MEAFFPQLPFETDSLICVPLSEPHRAEYCSLFTDPRVMRKIAKPLSQEEANNKFNETISLQPEKVLFWAIEDANGAFIGIQGLILENGITSKKAEIGIMLKPSFNGRGVPVEAMGELVRIGLKKYGFERIFAYFNSTNFAVERFVKKIGFKVADDAIDTPLGTAKYCEISLEDLVFKECMNDR